MKNNYYLIENQEKFIDDIYDIDSMFYKNEYLWSKDYQRNIYNKNKDSFIMIGFKNKLIGYLNYLCINKDKYEDIKNSDTTIDNFELDEILPYNTGDNYLFINSVVIVKEHQNSDCIKLINDEFIKKIKEYEAKNIHIKAIEGIAISNDGKKYFDKLNFTLYKKLKDNNYLYILEDINKLNNK